MLHGSGRIATNDKVAKLVRLVKEAGHEVIVISDSDVRVRPDYLRQVTAPLRDPKVGAVTCFYVPAEVATFTEHLQTVGMMSDFYAGILVAWQLDGVKFALGPTIATTRTRLNDFGGYAVLENRPADDLLVGRLIAEQGYEVALLRYPVETVSDYQSMGELLHKRLRWIVVMRHMRPWGHLGLFLTQGLPWSLVAVAVSPTATTAAIYLGGVFFAARRDDLDDRHSRPEAAVFVERNAADPAVGRGGVPHLAHEFPAQQHSLARRGLLYSGRQAGPGGGAGPK